MISPVLRPAVLALLISSASAAKAETVTVEEYIGIHFGNQIGDAVKRADEVATSKERASEELADARSAFYAQLEQGILKSPQEMNFADLLYAKDIYYLSLYVSEGIRSATKRVNALDVLTGGEPLDGGIKGFPADDLFEAWVTDVRSKFGATRDGQLIFISSVDQLKQAIDATQTSYLKYQRARDQLEFKRWKNWRPGFRLPKPNSPEESVDIYFKYILNPEVEEAIMAKPAQERGAARKQLEPWLAKVRAVILAYEHMQVTPDVAVAYMRSQGDFSDADIAYFWKCLGKGKDLTGGDLQTAVEDAMYDLRAKRDAERYHFVDSRGPIGQYIITIRKWMVSQPDSPASDIENVYKSQPFPFRRSPYSAFAVPLERGVFIAERPLPTFRNYESPAPQKPAEPVSIKPVVKSVTTATPDKKLVSAPPKLSAEQPVSPPKDISKRLEGSKAFLNGLHLGQALDDVDRAERASIKLQAVIDNNPKAWGYTRMFFTGRVYLGAGQGAERLGVTWISDDPQRRVISITRSIPLPKPPMAADAVEKLMEGKMGIADAANGTDSFWWLATENDKHAVACSALKTNGDIGNGYAVSSGAIVNDPAVPWTMMQPSAISSSSIAYFSSLQFPDGHIDSIKTCPALFWAHYDANPTAPTLEMTVTDGSLIAKLHDELTSKLSQSDFNKLVDGK